MAITVVGTPEPGEIENGNDVTLTFNEAPIEGDFVLLVGGNSDHLGTDPIGPSTAGYTEDSLQHTASENFAHGVWWKFMGVTPDTTVTGLGTGDPQDATSYIAIVLRGVDLSTPIDATTVKTGPTTSIDPDLAAITTVTDNALVVITVGGVSADTDINHPSGYANPTYVLGVDTNRHVTSLGTKAVVSAGSEDPPAYDEWGSLEHVGFTIAIRPAGGAGLTATLLATGDGTIIGVVNELDAGSPLFSSIDEDIDSPDDADYINNAIAPGTVEYFPLLTDLPEAFGVAVSGTIRTRIRGLNFLSESLTLFAQLYKEDETTALSDEITVITVSANSAFSDTAALVFTGLDTSAGKPAWNGARLRYRWALT